METDPEVGAVAAREAGREVIEACRRGEAQGFAALFEAHRDRVYSIALRFSGDPTLALDITQETFLKLLSKIGEFRGEASFDSWLYRLVVNACLDHRRAGRRWSPLLEGWLGRSALPEKARCRDCCAVSSRKMCSRWLRNSSQSCAWW
ncbi:MAG: RNA polymerase sigma factor [Acidobacteriota bacterium]